MGKFKTYKQKGKTIHGQYLAQIDIEDHSQIIIVADKLKYRNDLFNKIKNIVKNDIQ